MKALICNDDGITASGILAAKKAVEDLCDSYVIAPETQQSGIGHALTLYEPLRVNEYILRDGSKGYGVSGTPTDAVTLALLEIMDERYKLFAKYGVSDAYEYNERFPNDKLPYIFVVIEEMARFTSNKSLKDHCTKAKENDQNEKLAELLFAGRAAAMTLWVTVQRPTKDNLSPDVKSSLGNILAFQTTNSINSRIICDSDDQLKYLRGRGHGYFINEGCEEEFQGFFISNKEIEKILKERNLYK